MAPTCHTWREMEARGYPSQVLGERLNSTHRMDEYQAFGIRHSRRAISVALLLVLVSGSGPAQDRRQVALELGLAVDVSSSVDPLEFDLQMQGLAAALQEPAVIAAVGAARPGGTAVALIQWSAQTSQRLAVAWSRLCDGASARAFGARIAATPRLINGGHTAAGSAIRFAVAELEGDGFVGLRRVIDLSGGGRVNDGPYPNGVRDETVARGITINGLAILNEIPLLDRHYRDHLIGGAGAFFITADDYRDFARAIVAKLVREIIGAPLAQSAPGAVNVAARPAGRGTAAPARRRPGR